MSRSFNLYRLQQVDSQLDAIQARQDEINALMKENQALLDAEARLKTLQVHFDEARKSLNTAEANTKAQRIKIEQTESRLYGGKVSNPKELQDLQNESAALRRYLETVEERQIEAMLAYEEAETDLMSAETNLDKVKASLIEQNASLAGEQTRLESDRKRLETERTVVSIAIDETDREVYATLRRKRSGVAVAAASGGTCSACGNSLSSSLSQAARSPNKLVNCDNCGRILYAG
jgi:predicted  nucleic acid-binding Zn-ribbon protein